MKDCLNCKKPFDAKKDAAKFCKDSCRGMWNRKYGKKTVAAETKLDLIFKKMERIEGKVNDIDSRIEYPLGKGDPFDAPPMKNFNHDEVGQWAAPKPKIFKSFEYYQKARMECDTIESWRDIKNEIMMSNLTPKQKAFLTRETI